MIQKITPLTEQTHDVTMADDSTGEIPAGARWQQRATRSRPGKTRGGKVQLSPLEAELLEAKYNNLKPLHVLKKVRMIH